MPRRTPPGSPEEEKKTSQNHGRSLTIPPRSWQKRLPASSEEEMMTSQTVVLAERNPQQLTALQVRGEIQNPKAHRVNARNSMIINACRWTPPQTPSQHGILPRITHENGKQPLVCTRQLLQMGRLERDGGGGGDIGDKPFPHQEPQVRSSSPDPPAFVLLLLRYPKSAFHKSALLASSRFSRLRLS